MRLSLSVTNYSWPGDAAELSGHLDDVVAVADRAGIDTVWVADHLLQAEPGTSVDEPVLEAYSTLGYLAARTGRVRLGTMVTGVTFRPPALLIKAVTTLDVLSRGRAWLGVGAGYQADEARMMGLPLPPMKERFAALEDTVRLARHMWAGGTRPYAGRQLRLDAPIGSPAPVQRPGPPVLVGGAGEQRTLPLVARYADACNIFDIPDGGVTVRHKLAVLERLCAEVGRPYADVEKTISSRFNPAQPVEAFVEHCAELGALGIQHVVVITTGPWTGESVERLARAVPALASH